MIEHIITEIKKDFESDENHSFLHLLGLLFTLLFANGGKITYKSLSRKISDTEIMKVYIRFWANDGNFWNRGKENNNVQRPSDNEIKEKLTLSSYLDILRNSLLYNSDLRIRNACYTADKINSEFSYSYDRLNRFSFNYLFSKKQLTVILRVIINEFIIYVNKLNELKTKCENIGSIIKSWDSKTNFIKGTSYWYSIKDCFVTEYLEEIIIISETSEYGHDTISEKTFIIKLDDNLYKQFYDNNIDIDMLEKFQYNGKTNRLN